MGATAPTRSVAQCRNGGAQSNTGSRIACRIILSDPATRGWSNRARATTSRKSPFCAAAAFPAMQGTCQAQPPSRSTQETRCCRRRASVGHGPAGDNRAAAWQLPKESGQEQASSALLPGAIPLKPRIFERSRCPMNTTGPKIWPAGSVSPFCALRTAACPLASAK